MKWKRLTMNKKNVFFFITAALIAIYTTRTNDEFTTSPDHYNETEEVITTTTTTTTTTEYSDEYATHHPSNDILIIQEPANAVLLVDTPVTEVYHYSPKPFITSTAELITGLVVLSAAVASLVYLDSLFPVVYRPYHVTSCVRPSFGTTVVLKAPPTPSFNRRSSFSTTTTHTTTQRTARK